MANNNNNHLVNRAEVVVFGFDQVNECSRAAFDNLKRKEKIVYYASYKHFGYNLGWIRLKLLTIGELVSPYSKRLNTEMLVNGEIRKIFSDSELIDIQQLQALMFLGTIVDLKIGHLDRTHLLSQELSF